LRIAPWLTTEADFSHEFALRDATASAPAFVIHH